MAEYYVSVKEVNQENGHQVHKDSCKELPELKALKYLGSYGSPEAAVSKSRGYFDSVSCCSVCLDA